MLLTAPHLTPVKIADWRSLVVTHYLVDYVGVLSESARADDLSIPDPILGLASDPRLRLAVVSNDPNGWE
jgi:hypothetical protein